MKLFHTRCEREIYPVLTRQRLVLGEKKLITVSAEGRGLIKARRAIVSPYGEKNLILGDFILSEAYKIKE